MTRPLADRLWEKVDRSGECWEWRAGRNKRGYGTIGRGTRAEGKMLAHRAAWLVTYGDLPPGLFVCHRCDNPACCRPDHLFLGTHADNMRDMDAKGRRRAARGEQAGGARLTAEQADEIRRRYTPGTRHELAAEFGIHPEHAYRIHIGKKWVQS